MGFLVNTGKRPVNISTGHTQHELHLILLVRWLSKRSLNAPTELEIHRSKLRNKYMNSTKYTFTSQGANFVNKASLHDLCTYLQYYSVYRKTTAILNKQATLDKTPFPHTANPLSHMTRLIPQFVSLFSWRHNPLWLYFHSPVTGFGLLLFEVS
jgi:hypothetical protein